MSEISSPDFTFEGLSEMEFFKQEEVVQKINEELQVTRAYRVRAAMFPETLKEGIAIPSTRIFTNQETAVDKLSQPSQILKEAIRNLINYQDDADTTVHAIPELLLLLNAQEQETVTKAAKLVHDLTRNDASRNAIVANLDIMKALLQTVANSEDTETIGNALGALNKLAHHEQGLLAIFQSGGIPILVQMLGSDIQSLVRYAISTLHNLIKYVDGAKKEVTMCGGIQKMVLLLKWDDVKFLTIVVDCLRMLAHSNQERKLIILTCNGHLSLVQILMMYEYEKLIWVTVRALKVLSVCASNKPAIVEVGGIQAIGRHLQQSSQRVHLNCLYTMSNLSDAACKIDGVEGILHLLIGNLNSNDATVVMLSIEILANMSCNNPNNKIVICGVNGVQKIFNVLIKYNTELQIVETAVRLIRHLTSRHPAAYEAQEIMREQGRIGVIASLLKRDIEVDVTQAVIEVVINLLQFEENWEHLNNGNVVSRIEAILIRTFQAFKLDDMEVLYECSLNALNVFARNAQVRKLLSKETLIPIVANLLQSHILNIQKYAVGLLCELANDEDGLKLIEECDIGDLLTALMETHNECIAPYAATILYKLSNDQSPEYKQELRSEIIKYPLFHDFESVYYSNADTEISMPDTPKHELDEYTYSSGYSAVPSEIETPNSPKETRLQMDQNGLRTSVAILDADL